MIARPWRFCVLVVFQGKGVTENTMAIRRVTDMDTDMASCTQSFIEVAVLVVR